MLASYLLAITLSATFPQGGSPSAARPAVSTEASHVDRFADPAARAAKAEAAATERLKHDSRDIDALVDRGAARLELGRLDDALADFRRAVDLAPDRADLHASYGYVLAQLNRRAAARTAFERALVLDASSPYAHYHLGRVLAASGAKEDARLAVVHLERALVLRPDMSDIRLDLVTAYRVLGEPALAAAQIRYLKDARPRDPRVAYAEGLLAGERGDFAASVERFRAALTLEPRMLRARRDLALALVRLGRWDEAERELEVVTAVVPDSFEPAYLRALAAYNAGRLDAAETLARRLTEAFPRASVAHTLLGVVLSARGGMPIDTVPVFRKARELDETSFDAAFYLGRALYTLRDFDGAAAALEAAVRLRPDDLKARFFLATALESLGSTDAALAQYEEIARRAPDSPEGHIGMGAVLGKQGKYDEAVASLLRAIEKDPGLFEGHYALGRALARLNRLEEAVASLRRATELEPGRPDAHYQLALALRRAGKTEEADREFETVRRLNEEFRSRTGGMGQPITP